MPCLPISLSAHGIFYNKTLFDAHGWSVPETLDEFYALCDTITAAGIRAYAPCLKYFATNETIAISLAHRDVFPDTEHIVQYSSFLKKEASSKDLLEPALNALKDLYDRGIITQDDYSSSATKNRQAMYAGKIAMIPYDMQLITHYEAEKPDCEIGFFGFPTDVPGERWINVKNGSFLCVSAKSMEDESKAATILKIMDYISTEEGQAELLSSFSGMSSLTSYQSPVASQYQEIADCIETGRVYYADVFGSEDLTPCFQAWVTGKATMDETLTALNNFVDQNATSSALSEPIGEIGETFTVLETSTLMADAMQEATGAPIALMLNNYFYKGNLTQLFKGPFLLPESLYIKGTSGEDYLTTYEITGANLRKLMEAPIINGNEVNATYAFAGHKMTYAAWNAPDCNVVSLTLADGTEIKDDRVYTVAAWGASIDESFISATGNTFPDCGTNIDLISKYISEKETVSPAKDGRLTLQWN